MAKLKRKDLEVVHARLNAMADLLSAQGRTLRQLKDDLRQWPASSPPGAELERLATLMDGVRVALERMGGNSLPSFRNDVLALRDQMGEFRREMSGYRSTLMVLSNWLETVTTKPEPPAWTRDKERRKRPYNRRKKAGQEGQSGQDVAPHNDQPEAENES